MPKEPPPVTESVWPPTDHVPGGHCPLCGARHEPEASRIDVPVVLAWVALVVAAAVLVGAFAWIASDLGWAALEVLRRGLGGLVP